MAHGSRERWVRITTAGFGVLLSTSLVGCLNWPSEKNKDTKASGKQPTPGLYGTPKLDNNGQLPGGSGAYKGPGGNLQQGTAFQPGGAGVYRPTGSNGINTNTGNPVQPVDYRPQPGVGSQFAAPGQPGVVNTGGYQPGYPTGGTGMSYSPTGGTPSLPLDIVPPGPPAYPGGTGMPVYGAPPGGGYGVDVGPVSPPITPPGAGAPGKG